MATGFRSSIPYREIELISGNNRDIHLSFIDMDAPVPRPKYAFPVGAIFKLRCRERFLDISKTGAYDSATRTVVFKFIPSDTSNVLKDTRAYYEIDVFFPTNERYTLMRGHLLISAIKGLNDPPPV